MNLDRKTYRLIYIFGGAERVYRKTSSSSQNEEALINDVARMWCILPQNVNVVSFNVVEIWDTDK